MREIFKNLPDELFIHQIKYHFEETLKHPNSKVRQQFMFSWFDDFGDVNKGDIITIEGNQTYSPRDYNLEAFPKPVKIKVLYEFWNDKYNCNGNYGCKINGVHGYDLLRKYFTEELMERCYGFYEIWGEPLSLIKPLKYIKKD